MTVPTETPVVAAISSRPNSSRRRNEHTSRCLAGNDKNHVHARHNECKNHGHHHGNSGGNDNGGGNDHGGGGDQGDHGHGHGHD